MKRQNVLKLFLMASLVFFSLLLFVACGNDDENNDTGNNEQETPAETGDGEEQAPTGERIELTIATWAGASEADEFDEIIAQLNASQDVYYLRQEPIPADYYTVLQTRIAGNQAPDLFWLAADYIPAYADNEAIVDVTEFLANQTVVDMSDYLEGALNTARFQGNLFGLPWIGQPFVVYYNADMFAAAGIERPSSDWTWDDLATAATALTGDGVYGFGSNYIPAGIFIWGEGGDMVTADGEVVIDSEAAIRGLERFNDVINSDFAAPRDLFDGMNPEQAFSQGIIAMFTGGAADGVENAVIDAGGDFEVGMAQMPAGSVAQVTFNWSASTVISSQTDHLEAAQQALVDLAAAQFEWRAPAPIESRLPDIAEIRPEKAYAVDTILLAAQRARGANNMPEQGLIGSAIWEELTSVILTNNYGQGGFDVAELARNAAEEMRAILD